MADVSSGRVLELATALFEVDVTLGVQLWTTEALLRAAGPAGLPARGEPVNVASYAETHGLGPYTPPPTPFPLVPTAQALIYGHADADWRAVGALLGTRYPAGHAIRLAALDASGVALQIDVLVLNELNAAPSSRAAFCLVHVPPLPIQADLRGLDGLRWVVARLLGPGGCPWDVRQTHESLRTSLLEEAHEVLEALDAGDTAGLSEELGDLLLSVMTHSEMARQAGAFALEDVLSQIASKLIGRHPHVFGGLTVESEGAVLNNWEQIKAAELAAKGRARPGALDGVPPSLPGLATAQKLVKKAARAGFTWAEVAQVWAKLREELDELAEAAASGERARAGEELGDVLFVLADLGRWLELDAEAALRGTNAKFRRRFGYVEAAAAAQGKPLNALGLDELLALWGEAKRH